VAGLNSGVCVVKDTKLWDNPDFLHVLFFNENNVSMGGMHLLIVEHAGKKYLTLPGINPSPHLLGMISAKEFLDAALSYAQDLARQWKLDGVWIPTDTVIHSNRPDIQHAIRHKFQGIPPKQIQETRFSYDPDYTFSAVHEILLPNESEMEARPNSWLFYQALLNEWKNPLLAAKIGFVVEAVALTVMGVCAAYFVPAIALFGVLILYYSYLHVSWAAQALHKARGGPHPYQQSVFSMFFSGPTFKHFAVFSPYLIATMIAAGNPGWQAVTVAFILAIAIHAIHDRHELLKFRKELYEKPTVYHNAQHSLNVVKFSYDVARANGFDKEWCRLVSKAAILHDIDPAAIFPERMPMLVKF
jgi:hypothetical protein